MKRAKAFPTNRAPIPAQDVVRELCDAIAAAARGDPSYAGSEIRRAVTRGVKLFMAGAIDSRGASLINDAAAKASKAMHARARGAQFHVTTRQPVGSQRRINLLPSVALPPDRSRSVEDEKFDELLGLHTGDKPSRQTPERTA